MGIHKKDACWLSPETIPPLLALNKSPAGHARKRALFQIHVAVFIAHILGIR
jgi:hypothetical protein